MALKLVTSAKGIDTAEYWKIVEVLLDDYNNFTRAKLGLYLSRAARLADVRNVLEERTFMFTGSSYSKKEIYTKIKEPLSEAPVAGTNPDAVNVNPFVNAEDVLET
jgi:hypothetical protein